jgi:hypothetical protein
MKHWFRAVYEALRNWAREIPARVESYLERPKVVLPVERPPAKRAITVAYSAPLPRQKGPSIGQRRAGKRREFNQALRRVQ